MLLKHVLVNTLLALTSVTALPNLGTVNYSLMLGITVVIPRVTLSPAAKTRTHVQLSCPASSEDITRLVRSDCSSSGRASLTTERGSMENSSMRLMESMCRYPCTYTPSPKRMSGRATGVSPFGKISEPYSVSTLLFTQNDLC